MFAKSTEKYKSKKKKLYIIDSYYSTILLTIFDFNKNHQVSATDMLGSWKVLRDDVTRCCCSSFHGIC